MKMINKIFLIIPLCVAVLIFLFSDRNNLFTGNEVTGQGSSSGFVNTFLDESSDKIILTNYNLKTTDSSAKKDYLKIHFDALLVDTHNDFIWKVFDKGAVFGQKNDFTQSDLPRFKAGGVDVQIFAVWIPMNQVKKSYRFTISQINRLKSFETDYFQEFEFAKSYDDIARITSEKKLCGLIGIEGGTAIEKNLDNINAFFDLGVRYIGLTWNNSNFISTSAKEETENGKPGGLSGFGIEVIKRMNEVGMLIDVSHLSEAGFRDVMENSSSPVIASHSNCYSIAPHFRNLKDDQIKAIAKSGGYIGINFYDAFLDKDADKNRTMNAYEKYPDELNALNEKYGDDLIKFNEERNKFLQEKNIAAGTTIDKVIEHIDYIKNLVGVDYIGIGSDFDGGITPPNELYDASCYPELTKKLVERGYTEEEIKKILGGNFLRVFKQVCG